MAGTRIRRAPERLDIVSHASGVQSQLSMRSIKQRGAAPAQAKSGKAKGTGKAGTAFVGVHVDRAADPGSDVESVTHGADDIKTSRTDSRVKTPCSPAKASEAARAPEGDTEDDDDGQTSSDSEEERRVASEEDEEEENADEPDELCEYEKKRLIKIKDNQAMMVSCGMMEATTQVSKASGSEATARRKIAQAAGPAPDPEPCAPTLET